MHWSQRNISDMVLPIRRCIRGNLDQIYEALQDWAAALLHRRFTHVRVDKRDKNCIHLSIVRNGCSMENEIEISRFDSEWSIMNMIMCDETFDYGELMDIICAVVVIRPSLK